MSMCYRDVVDGTAYLSTDPDQMFPRWSRDGRKAWKAHDGGYAMLDGKLICETVGNWPCAWSAEGLLYIQRDATGQMYQFDPNLGVFVGSVPAEYRSEGCHHIAADGTPVMGGGQTIVVNGVQLWNAAQDGENWTGLSNGGGPSGCVALVTPTQSLMWVAPSDIPFPPRISGMAVAISAPFETPAPDAVPWVPFSIPATEPEPVPPLTVGPQRACWIDDMSGLGFGNASGAGFSSHVFEDARFIYPEHEPCVIALVHGPFEGSLLSVTIPMAQRLKKPVILSYDGHSQADLQSHRKALEAAGLVIWEGPSTYPLDAAETAEEMYTRLALTLMGDSRPHALICASYRVGGRSEQDIAAFAVETNNLKERVSHIQQVAHFGADRPPIIQWCRDFWRAVTLRTPVPFIPPVVAPAPVVSGIAPAPMVGGPSPATLTGRDLALVDRVLLSTGQFTITHTTDTTIEGIVTFHAAGTMQLVAYVAGQPSPNFFFTVQRRPLPTPPNRPWWWWLIGRH